MQHFRSDPVAIWLEPGHRAVVSTPRGEVVRLALWARLLLYLARRAISRSPRGLGAPTASTLASIAEASHALPSPWSAPPPPQPCSPSAEKLRLSRDLTRATPFASLLRARHSAQRFGGISLAQVWSVLEPVVELHEEGSFADGSRWARRGVPSAGGRHPLTVYVAAAAVDGMPDGLWRLDPDALELTQVPGPTEELARAIEKTRPSKSPATIVAQADFRRTTSRYPAGTAHVWRDAGVLLGLLHIRCVEMGLNSRLLGLGGALGLDERPDVAWVGGLAIGDPGRAGPAQD